MPSVWTGEGRSSERLDTRKPLPQTNPSAEKALEGLLGGSGSEMLKVLADASLGMLRYNTETQQARAVLLSRVESLPQSQEVQEILRLLMMLELAGDPTGVTRGMGTSGAYTISLRMEEARSPDTGLDHNPVVTIIPKYGQVPGLISVGKPTVSSRAVAEYLEKLYTRDGVDALTAVTCVDETIQFRLTAVRTGLLRHVEMIREAIVESGLADRIDVGITPSMIEGWRTAIVSRTIGAPDLEQESQELQNAFRTIWLHKELCEAIIAELASGISAFSASPLGIQVFSLIESLKQASAGLKMSEFYYGPQERLRLQVPNFRDELGLFKEGWCVSGLGPDQTPQSKILRMVHGYEGRVQGIMALCALKHALPGVIREQVDKLAALQRELLRDAGMTTGAELARAPETQQGVEEHSLTMPPALRPTKFRFVGVDSEETEVIPKE